MRELDGYWIRGHGGAGAKGLPDGGRANLREIVLCEPTANPVEPTLAGGESGIGVCQRGLQGSKPEFSRS